MNWIALTYHEVTTGVPADAHFAVPRGRLAAQLDLARELGFAVTTMDDAARREDPRAVAFTFDDGDVTHWQHALPELADRGMRASFFVITDRVGTPGYVSWPHLREMSAAGMAIGSHTASHPFLSTLDARRLREELRRSKEALDDALGQDTTTLALPGGDEPSRACWPVVREAGFTLVATSRPGANGAWIVAPGGCRLIRRMTVRHGQPPSVFERQLRQDPRVVRVAQLKFSVLEGVRGALGRERYARWRRWFVARHPDAADALGS